jgi:hypothetical protein
MKKKVINKVASVLLFSLMPLLQFAQTGSGGWNLLKQEGGVTFSYQITQCNGKDFLVYKVENTSSHPVTIMSTLKIKGAAGNALLTVAPQPIMIQPGKNEVGNCAGLINELVKPLPHETSYQVELIDIKIH